MAEQNVSGNSLSNTSFEMATQLRGQLPNCDAPPVLNQWLNSSTTGPSGAVNIGVSSFPTRAPWLPVNESSQPVPKLMTNSHGKKSLISDIPKEVSNNFENTKPSNSSSPMYKFKHFDCNVCTYRGISLKLLDEHTKTVHRKYWCTVCSQSFRHRSSLCQHSLIHLHGKPSCKVCGKSYSHEYTLVKHMVVEHNFTKDHAKWYLKSAMTPTKSLQLVDGNYRKNYNAPESIQFQNATNIQSNAYNTPALSTLAPLTYPTNLNNNPTTSSSMGMSINNFNLNPQRHLLNDAGYQIEKTSDVENAEDGKRCYLGGYG